MKTRADVAKLMSEVFADCQKTREAGQKEYAHDEENALRNFEQTGLDLGIPREKVLYIFAKKHWDGVLAWINGHRSQRENVRGRIKDIIVYLILLWSMVDDDEAPKMSPQEIQRNKDMQNDKPIGFPFQNAGPIICSTGCGFYTSDPETMRKHINDAHR